ncbi:hypothetical protein D9613_010360 [Agrocybe pediades]|uniref:Uncharacterized protein n=1 Tax=Agrocybe pediades TaxID=84607 RepID=A0A8H4VI50_9AGAR|nr:hypothetical protein D9613_010360 [Agrocybe pediades]
MPPPSMLQRYLHNISAEEDPLANAEHMRTGHPTQEDDLVVVLYMDLTPRTCSSQTCRTKPGL